MADASEGNAAKRALHAYGWVPKPADCGGDAVDARSRPLWRWTSILRSVLSSIA